LNYSTINEHRLVLVAVLLRAPPLLHARRRRPGGSAERRSGAIGRAATRLRRGEPIPSSPCRLYSSGAGWPCRVLCFWWGSSVLGVPGARGRPHSVCGCGHGGGFSLRVGAMPADRGTRLVRVRGIYLVG